VKGIKELAFSRRRPESCLRRWMARADIEEGRRHRCMPSILRRIGTEPAEAGRVLLADWHRRLSAHIQLVAGTCDIASTILLACRPSLSADLYPVHRRGVDACQR
jgi:hypothetical protein